MSDCPYSVSITHAVQAVTDCNTVGGGWTTRSRPSSPPTTDWNVVGRGPGRPMAHDSLTHQSLELETSDGLTIAVAASCPAPAASILCTAALYAVGSRQSLIVMADLNRKRSNIWMHFSPAPNKPDRAKCDTCSREYSYRCGSTSNLFLHLRNKHPSVAGGLQQKRRRDTTAGQAGQAPVNAGEQGKFLIQNIVWLAKSVIAILLQCAITELEFVSTLAACRAE